MKRQMVLAGLSCNFDSISNLSGGVSAEDLDLLVRRIQSAKVLLLMLRFSHKRVSLDFR